jgi:hypothetical protein
MPSTFSRALLAGGLALILVFAASPLLAQEVAPVPAPRDFSGPQTLQPQTAPSEGIAVHGHWAVTVTDPATSESTTYEFKNDLASFGAEVLARLFVNDIDEIELYTIQTFSPQPVCGSTQFCSLDTTVEYVEDPDAPNDALIVWTGSVTSENTTEIQQVFTRVTFDGNQSNGPFTGRSLTPAIPVEAGQIVSVRVEVSFE